MELIHLTQEELNGAGIRTSLTQNDLIEVIVDEKLRVLNDELEAQNLKVQGVKDRIDAERNKVKAVAVGIAVDKLAAQSIHLSEEDIERMKTAGCSWSYNDSCTVVLGYPKLYIQDITSYGSRTKKESVDTKTGGNEYISTKPKLSITINANLMRYRKLTDEVSYNEEFSVRVPMEIDNPFLDLIEEAKEIEQESYAIRERYKELNLNAEALVKQTRVAINKQLITSGGAQLRDKIQDVFGLQIEGKKK
jgi:hypothetical protein